MLKFNEANELEIVEPENNLIERENDLLNKVVLKCMELTKALCDKYGFDARLVFADFMRDIDFLIDPKKMEKLDMNNPLDVLTKDAYDKWVLPSINDIHSGRLSGMMVNNFLSLSNEEALDKFDYLIKNAPQQLPSYLRLSKGE